MFLTHDKGRLRLLFQASFDQEVDFRLLWLDILTGLGITLIVTVELPILKKSHPARLTACITTTLMMYRCSLNQIILLFAERAAEHRVHGFHISQN